MVTASGFCKANNNLGFSTLGECVSAVNSLAAKNCPDGIGHGQCVSAVAHKHDGKG